MTRYMYRQKKRAEEAAADDQGQLQQTGGLGHGGKARRNSSSSRDRDELAQALRDNILSQVTLSYGIG